MSEPLVTQRPMPVADELSRPFWEGLARHELVIQLCLACGSLRHPPSSRCPGCGSIDPPAYKPVSGRMRLRSWVTVHIDALAGVEPPYLVGEADPVEQEGVTLVADITGVPVDELSLGHPLEVGFQDLITPAGEPFTLLRFTAAGGR